MAGDRPKKFKAETSWTDKEWDWPLYQRIEEHLRQTVGIAGLEQVVDIEVKDQQSTLNVGNFKDAEARIVQEGTSPSEAYVSFQVGEYYEGRTAWFRVSYGWGYGEQGWNCKVSWNYPIDVDVRAAKASFDDWLGKQREQQKRAKVAVGSQGGPKDPWWKPDFRHVRDHLVADVIWAAGGLGAIAGIGWLIHQL
jgi:hypothetical protein